MRTVPVIDSPFRLPELCGRRRPSKSGSQSCRMLKTVIRQREQQDLAHHAMLFKDRDWHQAP